MSDEGPYNSQMSSGLPVNLQCHRHVISWTTRSCEEAEFKQFGHIQLPRLVKAFMLRPRCGPLPSVAGGDDKLRGMLDGVLKSPDRERVRYPDHHSSTYGGFPESRAALPLHNLPHLRGLRCPFESQTGDGDKGAETDHSRAIGFID